MLKPPKAAGANLLRGGAFKPRTSPYAFQGMGSEGLDILVAAREATGLPIVSELMDDRTFRWIYWKSRLDSNRSKKYAKLRSIKEGRESNKETNLIKKRIKCNISRMDLSAEYIMASGNPNVILCERGVRTFESYTRNTLDLQAIPVIKELTHLPIIIDPAMQEENGG